MLTLKHDNQQKGICMKKQTEEGFALGIILVVIIVVGLAGLIAYRFLTTANTVSSQPSKSTSQAQITAPAGTTASIDNLITQDTNSEASINTSYGNSDQTAVQNSNTAADGIGGAYDETAF